MERSRRLSLALGLNVGLVLAQATFGLGAHSLGLLADAGHNLSDVAALLAALIALRWARRAPTAARSFGYHRGTILAAAANAAALLAVSGWMVWAAADRLAHPVAVHGLTVVVVALAALCVNAAAARILHDGSADLNMRAALLHMVGDAAASGAVALAGIGILADPGLHWLDPLASIAIAALISVEAIVLLRQASDVLLESTPADVDLSRLVLAMRSVDGVDAVHDLHVWSLSSEVRALSAHVVLIGCPTLEEAQAVADQVKAAVHQPFAIAHATLELECSPCDVAGADPCAMVVT